MADTSPVSKSNNKSGGYQQPVSKKFVLIIVLVIAVAVSLLLYAMYSSKRNDADGAVGRQSQQTDAGSQTQQQAVSDASRESKQTAKPVSEVGQEVKVKVIASSGQQLVNTFQTTLEYPADKLQYVKVETGTAFPMEYATDAQTPGVIRLVRTVNKQSQSVRGEQQVVTVTFKKLAEGVDAAKSVSVKKAETYLVTSSDNRNLITSGQGTVTVR